MRESYIQKSFQRASLVLIQKINEIIADYKSQGYKLTVRQLYYQLVSKALVPNTEKSYKSVIGLVNDGRLAGLIDWEMIEDRTREFVYRSCWETGASILKSCAAHFHMDRWKGQEARVYVIVEKEALVSVMQKICTRFDLPLLAARGYPSSTVLRDFAKQSLLESSQARNIILHLGDHDPSGIDMSRDLESRLAVFSRDTPVEFRRIALNYDQVEELKPPPNPAKVTDSRFEEYAKTYGRESWELDALPPKYMVELVEREVSEVIDWDAWWKVEEETTDVKDKLQKLAENFDAN